MGRSRRGPPPARLPILRLTHGVRKKLMDNWNKVNNEYSAAVVAADCLEELLLGAGVRRKGRQERDVVSRPLSGPPRGRAQLRGPGRRAHVPRALGLPLPSLPQIPEAQEQPLGAGARGADRQPRPSGILVQGVSVPEGLLGRQEHRATTLGVPLDPTTTAADLLGDPRTGSEPAADSVPVLRQSRVRPLGPRPVRHR